MYTKENSTTKGVILRAVYGTYKGKMALELTILSFDTWMCHLMFIDEQKIKKIFEDFKGYHTECNTEILIHQNCVLLNSEGTNVPKAIASYKGIDWIYNDNDKVLENGVWVVDAVDDYTVLFLYRFINCLCNWAINWLHMEAIKWIRNVIDVYTVVNIVKN